MVKHTYRSSPVKSIRRDELGGRYAGRALILGIDVAKVDFKVAIMDGGSREVLAIHHWKAPGETRSFVSLAADLKEVADSVVAVLEPTGTYGDPLREMLGAVGVDAYRVSAKHTSDMSEVYDNVPSQHDAKCAAIIARLHAEGRSARWLPYSTERRDLIAAVEIAVMYDRQEQACVGRLEAWLARYFPELGGLLELTSATLLALLARFGGPARMVAASDEARELMRSTGGVFLLADKIDAVIQAARTTTGAPMSEGEVRMMKQLAQETNRQRVAANAASKELEKLGAQLEPVRHMAPVIGTRTAAILYAEVGDPGSFKGPDAFVKGLGLNLKIKNSGKPADVGRLAITKRGSPLARQHLYMATLRRIQMDAPFTHWYARKVERDNERYKLRGVIALMRKLAKGLWHVARGAPFDSSKLFDVARLGLNP